jgi:hypothetical protein
MDEDEMSPFDVSYVKTLGPEDDDYLFSILGG